MTTIDEIMACVYRSQFAASAYEASYGPGTGKLEIDMFAADGEVQALITQAIAEARADGARVCAKAIRAMSLPDSMVNVVMDREHGGLTSAPDKREVVRLTDEQIEREIWSGSMGPALCSGAPVLAFAHAIETAVLAANGMTK